jgi:hypothetical protein
MKLDEVGEACSKRERSENTFRMLVGEPEWKSSLGSLDGRMILEWILGK